MNNETRLLLENKRSIDGKMLTTKEMKGSHRYEYHPEMELKKKRHSSVYKTYRLKGTREMTSTFLCNAVIVSLPFVLVRMKRTANSHIAGLQGLEDWSKICINYQ